MALNKKSATFKKIEGLENFDKVIDIDQSPIGRTPRSNPATYTGAFTHIRDWFSGTSGFKKQEVINLDVFLQC